MPSPVLEDGSQRLRRGTRKRIESKGGPLKPQVLQSLSTRRTNPQSAQLLLKTCRKTEPGKTILHSNFSASGATVGPQGKHSNAPRNKTLARVNQLPRAVRGGLPKLPSMEFNPFHDDKLTAALFRARARRVKPESLCSNFPCGNEKERIAPSRRMNVRPGWSKNCTSVLRSSRKIVQGRRRIHC